MNDPAPAAASRRFAVPYQPYLLGLGRLARRLPAVVPVLLFLAIAWVDFGAGLNIPTLFWEGGLVAGLSVTLLFAYVWLVTFVLDNTFDKDTLAAGTAGAGGTGTGM